MFVSIQHCPIIFVHLLILAIVRLSYVLDSPLFSGMVISYLVRLSAYVYFPWIDSRYTEICFVCLDMIAMIYGLTELLKIHIGPENE